MPSDRHHQVKDTATLGDLASSKVAATKRYKSTASAAATDTTGSHEGTVSNIIILFVCLPVCLFVSLFVCSLITQERVHLSPPDVQGSSTAPRAWF